MAGRRERRLRLFDRGFGGLHQPGSKVTRYGLDAAGRITSVTNANQEVIQLGYDSFDNITNLMDGLKHATTWQYNQYGWLTNKVDGLGRNAFQLDLQPTAG